MDNGKYCYPNSDVLINNYNIHNKALLEKLEIQKVTVKLLGLDIRPERIEATFDIQHLIAVHRYLFLDLYNWAGLFRDENLYKSERVLAGGSAEYADYKDIEAKLKAFFDKYGEIDWNKEDKALPSIVVDFLVELWSIHPFREGNTRTCVTFLWHYLQAHNIEFHIELIRNNPMYVRDSLVMANYEQKEYLTRIITDAILGIKNAHESVKSNSENKESYRIAKSDYDAFKAKYSVKK